MRAGVVDAMCRKTDGCPKGLSGRTRTVQELSPLRKRIYHGYRNSGVANVAKRRYCRKTSPEGRSDKTVELRLAQVSKFAFLQGKEGLFDDHQGLEEAQKRLFGDVPVTPDLGARHHVRVRIGTEFAQAGSGCVAVFIDENARAENARADGLEGH